MKTTQAVVGRGQGGYLLLSLDLGSLRMFVLLEIVARETGMLAMNETIRLVGTDSHKMNNPTVGRLQLGSISIRGKESKAINRWGLICVA